MKKKELLKKFNEFKISKKLFLYVDNLDDKSLNKIKDIENKLLEISTLTLEKQKDNEALNEYKKEYFLYQNSLNLEKLKQLKYRKRVRKFKIKSFKLTIWIFCK